MSDVIINFKICDNCAACNGIGVCPTGAFHFNEEKKTLEIDEEKCIKCGLCATSEDSCSVGAIKFAKTEEEKQRILKEIEDDPRTIADLMQDRYGGQPIFMPFTTDEDNLQKVLSTSRTCLVELLDEEECLIKSIPIKVILKEVGEELTYRKVPIESEALLEKYDVKELPAMLVFRNNELLGKVEGYYSVDEAGSFINKLKEIVGE